MLMNSRLFGLIVPALFFTSIVGAQTLVINEFLASNDTNIADPQGDFDDWVELYNYGSNDVDIAGMYFTDGSEPLWMVPTGFSEETTIQAGGYLILWFDKDSEDGPLHIEAKLSGNGESVFIYATDGTTVIDSVDYNAQIEDISYARVPDASEDWQTLDPPTPGVTNGMPPANPVISSVIWPAEFSEHMEEVLVEADISDDGHLVRVDLYYSVDGGAETTLPMTELGLDNIWTVIIPGQAEFSNVSFRLEAEDNDTGVSQSGSHIYGVVSATNEVVINELFYHPTTDDYHEFLELYNAGMTAVDLSGWNFSQGISDTIPDGTILAAGDFLVLASDADSFAVENGFAPFQAWISGSISNGGEDLQLNDALGQAMDYISYDDGGEWPSSPDGDGPSLELIDATANNQLAINWQASYTDGGTPGAQNSEAGPAEIPLVSISHANGVITLSWPQVINAVSYSVYAASSAYGEFLLLQTTTATSLVLPAESSMVERYYHVSSNN
jgi:hypothetical protein